MTLEELRRRIDETRDGTGERRLGHWNGACPFCGATETGGRGSLLQVTGWRPNRQVECLACGAKGPSASTTALAWAAWRERVS